MELRCAHEIEVNQTRFVVIFKPPDFGVVEFTESVVETTRQVPSLARGPREAQDGLFGLGLAASVDNVIDNFIECAAVDQNLQQAVRKTREFGASQTRNRGFFGSLPAQGDARLRAQS